MYAIQDLTDDLMEEEAVEEYLTFEYEQETLACFWESIRELQESEEMENSPTSIQGFREQFTPDERRYLALRAVEGILLEQLEALCNGDNPAFLSPNRKDWNYVLFDPDYGLLPVEDSVMALGVVKTSFKSRGSRSKYIKIISVLQMILKLLVENSWATQRDLYYQRVKEFRNQNELNDSICTISSILQISRYDLHILTCSKGLIYGDFQFVDPDRHHTVDCGKSVINVPDNVLGIEHMASTAQICLVIEKDAIFQKLVNSNLLRVLNGQVILITAKGVPDVNTRQLLHRIYHRFKIPMFALMDGDPYGIDIMFVYKYGSLSMAWCCENMSVPALRWIGVHPSDFEVMDNDQLLDLTEADVKKCHSLLCRPYMDEFMQEQIEYMLELNKKAEIQSESILSYLVDKINIGEYI